MIANIPKYKNASSKKGITRNSPLCEYKVSSVEEENGFFNIIQQLLEKVISKEDLSALEQELTNFPRELIPDNITVEYISQIIEKYKNTQDISEEKCLILSIECFSVIENYRFILNDLDFVNITMEKISSSENSNLMLKVVSNVIPYFENKDDSLKFICNLFQSDQTDCQTFDYSNYCIFDYLIQFLYRYSICTDEIESECTAQICDTILLLFQKCDEESMIPSQFSIERIFWILNNLISKSTYDFSTILSHPFINNKNHYLYNSCNEVTVAYIILSGKLFSEEMNPFDLHIYDFIPLLISKNKSLISTSICTFEIMIEYSQEMVDELRDINLSLFEGIYDDVDYSTKIEIAYLYLHLINQINHDQLYDFFMDNSNMFFNFLNLENHEILAYLLGFFYHLHSIFDDEMKFEAFTSLLLENGFRDFLNDLIEYGRLECIL